MDAETRKYQIAKLPEDLKSMVDSYSDALDIAKKMEPTFAPLRLLGLLREMNDATIDLENIAEVAIEMLDGDGDQFRSMAVVKGALALEKKQSKRLWQLTGLVLQQMQLTQPIEASSAPGEIQ